MKLTSHQRWTLIMTSLASFMVALDTLVVSTALTRIRADLGASLGQLEWTISAYTLSFAGVLMAASAIGERIGPRRTFAFGLSLFTAASAGCALAPSMDWLIATRAIQGIGGAFVMPLAMALLSEAFPPAQRAKALGTFSGVTGLAVLSGPVIGGAIAQGLAWQWIFWLNVPIGILAIPVVIARLKESRGTDNAFDTVGGLLVTGASLGLVWGLVRGNSAGWASAEVLAALIAGCLLAAGFVRWELRTARPMLPMRLFRSRAFAGANASSFLLNAALIGTLFFITQFLQTGRGYGPLSSGLRLLPWTATLFIIAPIAGALMHRTGERSLVVVGLALQAIGFGWVALIASVDVAYWQLIPPLIVAGAGVSMAMPASQNAAINAVAPQEIGTASGTYQMLRMLGSTFGVAILAAAFAGSGSYTSPHAFTDGFTVAVAIAAGLSLLGALAGATIPPLHRKTQQRDRAHIPEPAAPIAEGATP